MTLKELLLSKRWILKSNDRDNYYRIKDNAKSLQALFQEKLGYSLISNQNFMKLDKVPGKAEPWMGITDFQHVKEYQMFCFVLIFLEDKDGEDQFILTNLIEFIQMQFQVNDEFWLNFSHRKMLVNVLKFCLKEQLLVQNDGNTEGFIQNIGAEVLFESTGLSRYFMRNFVSNIFEWQQPSDFMNNEWIGVEQDRGVVRRQRIYRRLMLSCGIYQENSENDDFAFIRNYRKRIENDFNDFFPCELQVYASSAFLKLEDEVKVGQRFPKSNALDELVLIFFTYLRKQIKNKQIPINDNETICLSMEQVNIYIQKIIKQNMDYLPSTYRQKNIELLSLDVLTRMMSTGLVKKIEEKILFYPGVGKIMGQFGKGTK